MTNGKKYSWGALRWVLTALIWLPPLTAYIICRLVPREEYLRYAGGSLEKVTNLEERFGVIFAVYFMAAAGLTLVSMIASVIKGKRGSDKAAGAALSLMIGFAAVASDAICGVLPISEQSLMIDFNEPYGFLECETGGELYVLCTQPHGLHHTYVGLYRVEDGKAVFLGTSDERGSTNGMEDIEVTPAAAGWTVSYTQIQNKEPVRKSFTIPERSAGE